MVSHIIYVFGFSCLESFENHLFLFSAGSLSNLLCHELYSTYPSNTYIDIGSSLNPFMGFPLDRRYLRQYWIHSNEPIIRAETRKPNPTSLTQCLT